MFLYNINYDKETNAVNGDKIVIPEGINTESQLVLTGDIDKKFNVFIDFSVPKNRKFRSEQMVFSDNKYFLTIPNTIASNSGDVEIQLVFIAGEIIEKSLVNHNLITIRQSINAVDNSTEISKTVIDTLMAENTVQNSLLTIHENRLIEHDTQITETEKIAKSDKFEIELIYDMTSTSAEINHGFPNGILKGKKMEGLNLSKYRFLIISYQRERNLAMLVDLSAINIMNDFYINSISGCTERIKTFGLVGFEVIINKAKTYVHVNNTVRTQDFTAPSILMYDTGGYVSKIVGII